MIITIHWPHSFNCYTTLTADFADSAMTPRLILRHRRQTPRLPSRESPGHARLALLIYPIKRCVARRSYQINLHRAAFLSDQPRIARRSCQIMTISYIVYQSLFSRRVQQTNLIAVYCSLCRIAYQPIIQRLLNLTPVYFKPAWLSLFSSIRRLNTHVSLKAIKIIFHPIPFL